MICPNCGRELAEGEVCTCTTQPAVEPISEEPVGNSEPQQPPVYSEPAPEQNDYTAQGYYQPPVGGPYYIPNQQDHYSPMDFKMQARTDYPEGYKIKKKYVAVILGLCLGVFGVHNWYLGNKSRFITQLLIGTLGSIFFGLGAVVTEVWSLVETIQILTEDENMDANGFKISTLEESIARSIKD